MRKERREKLVDDRAHGDFPLQKFAQVIISLICLNDVCREEDRLRMKMNLPENPKDPFWFPLTFPFSPRYFYFVLIKSLHHLILNPLMTNSIMLRTKLLRLLNWHISYTASLILFISLTTALVQPCRPT